MKQILILAIAFFAWTGCAHKANTSTDTQQSEQNAGQANNTLVINGKYDTATYAGGCFWCMQPPFDTVKGVIQTLVGYTGGSEKNPTYEQVSAGITGHAESVEVIFDPKVVTYEHLLDIFWHNIDPTTLNAQFADHGRQYRSAIFYNSKVQREQAEASKLRLAKSDAFDKPIVTEITAATTFWPAEEYHQKFYQKDYRRYKEYRIGSGREGFLKKKWGQ